jgi:CRP-like cAMP-binding protein
MKAQYSLIDFRKQIERFTIITDDDWEMLLPFLEIKKVKKNHLFSEEGKKANEVGFILNGTFRQYYTKDGEEKTTYFFFENQFLISYISCITSSPSLITIEALSESTYLSFPYKVLVSLYDKSKVWGKFGRLVSEYVCIGLEERMVSLLLKSPEERYLDLISSNKQKIIERIPQHYIANYLGITPVSMSRIRNRVSKM